MAQRSSSSSTAADDQQGDKRQRRSNAILTALQQTGTVSVDTLSAQLGVSVVTIRHDLDLLEQQGLLQRTHGGAVSMEPLFYQPFRNDRSFLDQLEKMADEKRRIGRAAAALIQHGETIAITPGTTTAEVIRGLPLNRDITVITNTVNIAMELSKRKDVSVFVTGGHLRGDWFSLTGSTAVQSLENMLISTLFLGADCIDAHWGPSCFSADEAELNAALVRHARRKIAVVDHSKFGTVAKRRICETSELDMLITDSETSDGTLAEFVAAGVEILKA